MIDCVEGAHATEEAEHARRSAATSERINSLLRGILEAGDPFLERSQTTVREVLDRAAHRLGLELSNEPAVLASISNTIGIAYTNLALYEEAERHLTSAVDTTTEMYGEMHVETATALANLGTLRHEQGKYEEARQLKASALLTARRLLGEEHELTLCFMADLATTSKALGEYEQCEDLYRRVLDIRQRLFPDNHSQIGLTLNGLGALLLDQV